MTVSEFSSFYNLPRRRVELAVTRALEQNGGRFELPGLGAFQATKLGDSRTSPVKIEMYDVKTRAPRTVAASAFSEPPRPSLASDPAAEAPSDPASAPVADLASLSEYDLKRRMQAAKILALEQSSKLAQLKLRREAVARCANIIQRLLASVRTEISALHLDDATTDAIASAVNAAISDLSAVLPDIIAEVPEEQIELALTRLRAERIAAGRMSSENAAFKHEYLTNYNPSTSNFATGA